MFGNIALKTKCTEVKDLGSDRVKVIAQDMIDTMQRFNGIGLSANQISITERIIVVTDIKTKEVLTFVNPEIVMNSKDMEFDIEGCLSYPNIKKNIKRYKSITMRAFDLEGLEVVWSTDGYQARIIQHEVAHTQGKCLVSRKG